MSRPYPAPDYKPKYHLEPVDIEDLLQRAGPLSDAVAAYVEWGAITTWMMNGGKTFDDAIASANLLGRVASLSVSLVREASRHETDWPCLSGKVVTPALYGYSTEVQSEARQVAADVHALWEQAGRPHVDAARCKSTHRYLVACVRDGLLDPLPGISPLAMAPAPMSRGRGSRRTPRSIAPFQEIR